MIDPRDEYDRRLAVWRTRTAEFDKTHFIAEVLDLSAQVLLLPRPRRFGKTLALSMLRYYFEPCEEDRSDLFDGLSIWSAGAEYRVHFQRKPVIHLTFDDFMNSSFRVCLHLGLRPGFRIETPYE